MTWRFHGVLLGIVVAACASTPPPEPRTQPKPSGIARGAGDLLECRHKGQKDRVVAFTRGPGSQHPNVYRVYDVSLDVKNGKRILRCRQVDTDLDGYRDVIRTYNASGEADLELSDSDYDGQIDTWVRFARGRVFRESHDRNDDGKPDEFRTYSSGKLTRLQRDADFDGKLDTWEVYDGARLHRVGVDLDGDERVDRWYRDAALKEREDEQASEPEPEPTEAEKLPADGAPADDPAPASQVP